MSPAAPAFAPMLLPLVVCALALPAGRGQGPPAALPPARLEILEGRAVVALPTGVVRLTATSPGQRIAGPAHMELGAASRMRVGWSATGSLLLEGRATLEWRTQAGDPGELVWAFADIDVAHLEVRRGRVGLELPGGWSALLGPGAYLLRGRAGGQVELTHEAGLPVDLWPPRTDDRPEPPFTVLAGARLRLVGDARRPVSLAGTAGRLRAPHERLGAERVTLRTPQAAWRGFAWPWSAAGVGGEAPLPSIQPAAERAGPDDPVSPPTEPGASREPQSERDPAGESGGGAEGDPPGAPGSGGPGSGEAQEETPIAARAPVSEGVPHTPEVTPGSAAAKPAGRAGLDPDGKPLRLTGILVLTPYGPRWIERVLPADPRAPGQHP